jgi:hypothetical protein
MRNGNFKFLMAFWGLATAIVLSSCGGDVSDGSNAKATTGVRVSPDTITFSENGGSGSFTVELDTKPDADVAIAVASSDTTEATVDKSMLTFTAETWSTPQVVIVEGVDDSIPDGDQTLNILMEIDSGSTKDPNYRNLAASAVQDILITVTDDDALGVMVSPKALTFSENGGSDSFTVKLNIQPDDSVAISIYSSDVTKTIVDKDTLIFTPENWSTAQVVTVEGVDDLVADGNKTFDIVVNVDADATFDTIGFKSLEADDVADVEVTVIDDDEPGVTVTPKTIIFSESGSGSFKVMLNTEPSGDVVIVIAVADPGTTEVTADKDKLIFTPGDWSTAQTVNVLGEDDWEAEGNQTFDIVVNVDANESLDTTGYKSLAADDVADVEVTLIDNDKIGVTVNPDTMIFSESGSDSFDVMLNTKPNGNVEIDVFSSDVTKATVNIDTLIFTSDDWSTAQTVRVSGVEDQFNFGNQTVIINVEIDADATLDTTGYKSLAADDVTVTVIDDDTL